VGWEFTTNSGPQNWESMLITMTSIYYVSLCAGHHAGILLYSFFVETGSPYVNQAGLELWILLPQPPKGWGHRHTSLLLLLYS
jgi:hypothetical protein